jgi:transcription antitermination factor NusG
MGRASSKRLVLTFARTTGSASWLKNMPILNKEVSLYPDDLFDVEVNGDEDRNWWVLHTKARQEKAVARFLHHSRIAFYLPLISRMTMNRQRKYTSEIPLFAGYVFVYGSHDEVTACRQTERLANVLPVPDGKQLRSDLGGVLKLIECGAPLTAEKRVQPDQRVRIKSGALQGIEGIVSRRKNRMRIVVIVNFLQQGVAMDVEDWLLEPIQ